MDDEMKNRIFGKARELKSAEARFRGISVAQNLRSSQRERVKEVRRRAMESSGNQLNKKIIVVNDIQSKGCELWFGSKMHLYQCKECAK